LRGIDESSIARFQVIIPRQSVRLVGKLDRLIEISLIQVYAGQFVPQARVAGLDAQCSFQFYRRLIELFTLPEIPGAVYPVYHRRLIGYWLALLPGSRGRTGRKEDQRNQSKSETRQCLNSHFSPGAR